MANDAVRKAGKSNAPLRESFVERCVQEQVHRRDRGLVALDETLAEIPNEILISSLRPHSRHIAKALLQLALHLKTRELGENARRARLRNLLVEQSGEVGTRTGRTDPDLRLGVRADRKRRVQRHAVPDELSSPVVHASCLRQRPRRVRSLDLEAPLALVLPREADVVQLRCHRNDFLVIGHALQLGELHREEPRANDVVEQVRLGESTRLFHRTCNEWRVRDGHSGDLASKGARGSVHFPKDGQQLFVDLSLMRSGNPVRHGLLDVLRSLDESGRLMAEALIGTL